MLHGICSIALFQVIVGNDFVLSFSGNGDTGYSHLDVLSHSYANGNATHYIATAGWTGSACLLHLCNSTFNSWRCTDITVSHKV